jgi:hypothetical protein
MSMSISRLSVGNPETEQALRTIVEELGVPEGEVWTASITASSAAAAWEVVLDGAGRTKSDHVDWEIVQHEGLARFRRLFLGKDEQTLDYFKRSIRKLLWECVQFKDNPIRNHSPKLGEAFEEAVWNLLRHEDMKPVQVRFGVWREGPDGMKFVCKVEYASDRRVPWSWWSSLVRNPQDLASELTRALASRRKRQVVVAPSLRALGRRVARRGLRPTLPAGPHPATVSPAVVSAAAAPSAKEQPLGF